MIARRLMLTTLASLCAMVGVRATDAVAAGAATQFGSYGEEAEQLRDPRGIAVGPTGDLYVADTANQRIDVFDGSGDLLSMWGGNFENPTGVAVDDELSSLSYGDVYVVDHNHSRVEKLDSSGKFLLMFGGHVNETTDGDVCMAGEACKTSGTIGSANGEFSYWNSFASFIAVGPGGDVYVGDTARVEIFEPSGVWKENISLAGLSATGQPTALAVDSAGDVYVKDEGVAGVREFEANGTEKSTVFDEGSTSVSSLALDGAGNLYIGDSNGEFHVLEYDSSGKELDSFASNTITAVNEGLAFSDTTGRLYATEFLDGIFIEKPTSSVWILTPPAPGPLIDSESVAPELRGAARLEGTVNPEGNETTYHFEYVSEAQFKVSGFADATSTTSASIGSAAGERFDDLSVSVSLPSGTLAPSVNYYYRIVATNSQGTATGEGQSFEEVPPARITGTYAANVANTSATLGVEIDPLGVDTSYRLEYGTSSSYGHLLTGNAGEGTSYVAISRHLQGLEPLTTYYYRFVTSNEVGTAQGPEHTFTTQGGGSELMLPDGRAWELVSPVDKHGALIEPELTGMTGPLQAANDGSRMAYQVSQPITEKPTASSTKDLILSTHGSSGWSSQEIGSPGVLSEKEYETHPPLLDTALPKVFSSNLSLLAMEPGPNFLQPLSPEATERTIYLRDSDTGAYIPLVTPANVPAGTKFGGAGGEEEFGTEQQMRFVGATPDLSHVVFESPLRLTPEAIEGQAPACTSPGSSGCPQNLYEWNAGKLALVDVLPDGSAGGNAYLGRGSIDIVHAISNDGRRIVWAAGGLLFYGETNTLYVRDMVEGKTQQIGGPTARFETMSENGSMVFFWEDSALYAFDVDTGTTTDLTAHHPAGERAGVDDGLIMAASEDGTHVYYIAAGVLAPGAVSGENNLYVSHYNGTEWTTTLIGTLSKTDQPAHEAIQFSPVVDWAHMHARVSPNGRYLAFMSNRPLTGYDNMDALSGQPDEEVYLYDAAADRLVCASCDPSGARPVGVYVGASSVGPMFDRSQDWAGDWVAANLPGWREGISSTPLPPALYQPRYLSDSGRLFFNSTDALVAQDTNGLADVYEYEPAGVGSCESGGSGVSERSGGCVNLISSGTSSGESAFMDASETGDDVFFATSSKLVTEDIDTNYDVYDAHVCTTAVPCTVAPVSPPPCTSGDSCKAAPSPQPTIFGPTPSETFSGIGNLVEEVANKGVVKHKAKMKPKHAKKRRKTKRKARKAHVRLAGRTNRKGKG
jgi:hypothetical protein